MLVVVPTYKRLDCLRLSLLSVFNNELPSHEPCRLVLSNNYPPHRQDVEEIVSTLSAHPNFKKWDVIFNHRPQTVPAVDNWYQTILDFAKEDEMVVLHGDDDLLTPWSLADRQSLADKHQADFLLTGVCSGLTFVSSTSIHFCGGWPRRNRNEQGVVLSFATFEDFGNVFIGSHTYRNTVHFRAAIEKARAWTETQTWVDYSTRNLMFPYYLLLAVQLTPAKVVGSHWHGCIRGTSLEEKVKAPFNNSYGWNSGVLLMLMMDLLNQQELSDKPIAKTRMILENEAANWYLTLFLDPRVPSSFRKELLARVRLPLRAAHYWFGAKVILQQYLGLKVFSVRWDVWRERNIYSTEALLQRIMSHSNPVLK